jgi:chaperone required for assembly of F1-ATPase
VKRFYKDVSVGDDRSVLLDRKPMRTPSNARLVLPTRALAEAIAQEWRQQGDEVATASMHLTRLANTAVDRVDTLREEVADELLRFACSDLLSYRALDPAELRARQEASWNPLLDWAHENFGARLKTTHGVLFVEQDEEAIAAFERALRALDPWTLTGLQTATSITGSLVLALAIANGRLSSADAFALSRIDEAFQAEKWGCDAEAEKRARLHAVELEMAAKFIGLARP